MTARKPQESATTAQSALVLRAAFRQQLATLLERAGASRAVSDEQLTLVSRAVLDALAELDQILDVANIANTAANDHPLHNETRRTPPNIIDRLPTRHGQPAVEKNSTCRKAQNLRTRSVSQRVRDVQASALQRFRRPGNRQRRLRLPRLL